MFVAARHHPLKNRGFPIRPEALMDLHRVVFGEGFPEHAGTQRVEAIDIAGDPCCPPGNIGNQLAIMCEEVQARVEALESGDDVPELVGLQLEVVAVAHARLLKIHPFPDGNGRAARLLLNLMFIRFGLRPIEVKTADGYIPKLRRAMQGDYAGLVDLLLSQQERESLRLLEAAARARRQAMRRRG